MILLSQIDLGVRARSTLPDIPALADDISDKGLISPILLTRKSPALVTEYEEEYNTTLDPNCPVLLTAGGRRLAALTSLGVTILYPGTSCDRDRPGYLLREATNVLDLLLLEGRENRNRQDLDWRDDMALVMRAYRLARRKANAEGEYLVMKDFAAILGVPFTDLSIAEKIWDDYQADPEAYREAMNIYGALTVALKRAANEGTRALLHMSLHAKPVIRDLTPKAPEPQRVPDVITIPLSRDFCNECPISFMAQASPGFCDHIITSLTKPCDREFYTSCFSALANKGYIAIWVPNNGIINTIWNLEQVGFNIQPHLLIWNQQDFRCDRRDLSETRTFPHSYQSCLLAYKPGSILAKAQNASIYTCASRMAELIYGPGCKPPEVYAWILRAIALPGQVIYDPFAGTGASAVGALSVKCHPIGTTDKLEELTKNLKAYYNKQLSNVQFT